MTHKCIMLVTNNIWHDHINVLIQYILSIIIAKLLQEAIVAPHDLTEIVGILEGYRGIT